MNRILAINPGSTSTKVSLYEDKNEVWTESINHRDEELAKFNRVADQFDFRKDLILSLLNSKNVSPASLDALVGRGGQYSPIESGGYLVNEAMKEKILNGGINDHASNLGALIADAIASPLGKPAYIYDSVASDEMQDIARITGLPEIIRKPFSHVLNTKAMCRKLALKMGTRYEDMNVLCAHIGGGISINIHEKGRIIDSIEDDGGPFSVERAGVIPLSYVINWVFKEKLSQKEVMKRLKGDGGIKAHLGTRDLKEVEKRIEAGDAHAQAVYEAFAYQVSKGIGELSVVLGGNIDAIVLTGGGAKSRMLTDWITNRVKFIAPVYIMAGENEMESLAFGALRLLSGEEIVKVYAT